ncbi:winged helix-turn-helix domain-containing protein [Rhizobacter sp. OV335]|uniref:winged helix-turn-helix domain-containing protein n=1 Tax=Rhizobacter sp. OV335 TaxID=1500264 RepID=UPI00091F09F7|nr:winged helix-turn-helix domain-containing protein [Rhizobacter sp. OV335]SHN40125.1 DNA-binding winged helix-turn-helix (wHTH) domain-containing protein [Rhizobacter sp. OV335]
MRVDAVSELLITLPGGSLDLLGRRVLRHGEPVKVEPRAWRVLEKLARFRHRVVTKEELLAALSPDGAVSDAALRQAIRAARLAIGDDGPQPIIRSIPRVGYMFDVPSAPASASSPERATPGSLRDGVPSLIIGPLRNHTRRPSLQWAAHGLVACIAHGLSIDGRIQVQDAHSLETSWPQEDPRMLQMLRAAGARYAVVGSLTLAGSELALDLHVHDRDKKTVISIRAAAPAGLVLPAIEALRHALLGVGEHHGHELSGCSLLSIELFARAKHSAAMNRHPAALRALALLQHLDPGFPRLDLELLRTQAICGSDDGLVCGARLLEAARRNQDQCLEAQVQQYFGTLYHARGRLRDAAQSLEHGLVLGRVCMPPHWQGYTLTLLASVECRLGELHSVATRLNEAQTIFTGIGSHWGLLNVLWLRAIMSSLSGHAEKSIRWNRKLAHAARRLNATTALASVCLNLAGELLYADRLDEARECAEEATATALAIEANMILLTTVVNIHCLLHRQQGRPDAAAELLSLLPQPDRVQNNGYLWQAHGHAAMAAGRVDEAADCFLRAAAECRRHGNRAAEAPLFPWLVEALVRSGRLPLAEAELDRADAQAHLQDENTTANLLYPRALLARRRQQEPETRSLLARLATAPAALPLFRRLGQELSAAPPSEAQRERPVPMAPPNDAMLREYRFAHCMLDAERRELWVDGRRQTLAPKPFDVLLHLYRNRHRLVTQDELLDTVWRQADASPEVIAQAIARIRQVMRRSKTHAVRIKTVSGKGYGLVADAPAAPEEDTAATLLSDLHGIREHPLAVLPLAGGDSSAGVADRDLAYPLEVLGYTLAVHSMLKRMSAAEVQAGVDAATASTPEAIAAAIGTRSPGVHVLFARLARHMETLTLEYVLLSPASRIEGSMHDRSPTTLGRRLAARLLQLHTGTAQGNAQAVDESEWMARMFDLASRAAEEHRRSEALHVLDVVLDQDPDHYLAADLKARIEADRGALDGAHSTSTSTP